MTLKKKLPLGFSELPDMLTNNLVYVDKTESIHKLITTGPKYCLFTRPRRFGKSLTVSTLEAIFKSEKELFKNLWIGKENRYEWTKHPIIRIDLSMIDSSSSQNLKDRLAESLNTIAKKYNISMADTLGIDSQKERRYYKKHLIPGNQIFLIGLAFTFPDKKLTINWLMQEVPYES